MAISKGANTYLSTRNLERSNVALPGLALGDLGTNLIHDAAELVTQDVVLVHLDHAAVQEMEIRAADGAACDLEDDILGLDDFGPGHVRWKKVSTLGSFLVSRKKKKKKKKKSLLLTNLDLVLSHPNQRLHGPAGIARLGVVRDILSCDATLLVAHGLLGGVGSLRSCHY